jgi:tRNA-2-methylthio-N6-dimethylallyladenosine synthase
MRYDGAYTFKYSARENTKAWAMNDDVPEEVKGRRVYEIADLQHAISQELNTKLLSTVERILVEGPSKKSAGDWAGRTDTNKTVIFPKNGEARGEYIDVRIERTNSATLFGKRVDHVTIAH